ncbi:hypothetical protein PSHT_03312 [Puccinia striiformis]|uniref:Uncharacterized protein n=1 Tax=Puccinia striiformis TaxID=27350 RepID=A0A2S4WFT3_9BASI|nr:hypothetical protein PSHT_03312 [Puccinia striiformis]
MKNVPPTGNFGRLDHASWYSRRSSVPFLMRRFDEHSQRLLLDSTLGRVPERRRGGGGVIDGGDAGARNNYEEVDLQDL